MRNRLLLRLLAIALIGIPLLSAAAEPISEKPNFIIVFADDLGYGDLGCFGHPTIRTPHLDQMATEGMKLTSFYVAAPVCTPSRAGLLTGRLPVRSGMSGGGDKRVLYPGDEGGLPPEEITIAELLQDAGYATACIGKWHLGDKPEYMPNSQGFDYFFGLPYSNDMNIEEGHPRHASSMDPDADFHWWDVPLMRNGEIIERPADQNTLTRRYAQESVSFIKEHQDQPFFIYLAQTMPHVPLFASDDFRNESSRGRYGDVVEEIDWCVGEIIRTLRETGLAENTLVVFTSDNGPWLRKKFAGGSAGLLRDGKGSTWEGGQREPTIAWWPGRVPAGTVNSGIASTMDLFTTAVHLAGGKVPQDRVIDGMNLSELLFHDKAGPRNLFFYYRGDQLCAIRKGPWKAHFNTWDGYSKVPPESHNPPLLYNLDQDPSEQHDIAADHPDVVKDLIQEAKGHLEAVTPGEPQYYELSPSWQEADFGLPSGAREVPKRNLQG